jgi:hypothetical protein
LDECNDIENKDGSPNPRLDGVHDDKSQRLQAMTEKKYDFDNDKNEADAVQGQP